jgi:NhaC family Na+:H+ antiporter
MIILPLLRVDLMLSMAASGLTALLVSVFCQHLSLTKVLYSALMGFTPEGGLLGGVLSGGGVISMIMSLIMVSSAGILTGLLQGMGILNGIQKKLAGWTKKLGRVGLMNLLGLVCCMIFCNQTTSNIMQAELMRDIYPEGKEGRKELALDIANTGVTLSGLVPWCVACSIPLNVLDVGLGALPYSVLLYAIPLTYIFTKKRFFDESKN